MGQTRKPFFFVLIILSVSIVATFSGLWFTRPSRSTLSWQKKGADIDGEANFDYSGSSVSLSSDGNTVAIGADGNDGNGDSSGHVRIFQYAESSSTWTQMGVDIDGEASGDESGRSVSLSPDGKTVAVGAPFNDRNGFESGHVRVFQWKESSSLWTQVGADIRGEAPGDFFGWSVSLSSDGNIVAIGAPYNDGIGDDNGHVRIFQWIESSSTWTQMGADIDGESNSGSSVSLSSDGNTVAIGAGAKGFGDSTGHARIFRWAESTSSWTQMGADIDEKEYDYYESVFSVSLSCDGNTVAIGAPNHGGIGDDSVGSGRVRIFQWTESASAWTQVGADIDGEERRDRFGHSVSLSCDGNTVAVGAPYNGGGGDYNGHVRIFQWTESSSIWTQVGADIDGEVLQDESGSSVSLSSDGNTVAIGATSNGMYSGHVRILQWLHE